MNTTRRGSLDVRKLVYIAILTAIVFVLQFLPIKLGMFSITFVLVPIVIGVAICDWRVGAWLGLVFGAAVLISGDAAGFIAWNPFATVLIVLLKGTLAGFAAGVVYKLLAPTNRYLAVIASAVVAPVVNTAVFILGCLIFFYKDIAAAYPDAGVSVIAIILFGFVGLNFFIELGVNLILSPTIVRLVNIHKKA